MGDPGLTTPVQPVRRPGGSGTLVVGLAILGVVGLLAWHPWTGAGQRPEEIPSPLPVAAVPAGPIGPDASRDPDLFGGPTAGTWSGRVTGEWSIVAFLRSDPVSRDPLNLRQQQVAVLYGQPEAVGLSDAICDQEGTFLHRAAADLPTGEVRYLGIAFPPEESVAVRRIARLGEEVPALPIELGRIPGVGASLPAPPIASPPGPQAGTTFDEEAALDAGGMLAVGGTVPAAGGMLAVGGTVPADGALPGGGSAGGGDGSAAGGGTPPEPVRMFALAGGGPWPDGVYRFDVSTHEGLPTALFACIRP
jgi:hypothetical protein